MGIANISGNILTDSGSSLTGLVPYTGATTDVDLGVYKISSRSLITTGTTNGGVLLKQNSAITGEVDSQPYTAIKAFDTRYLYFDFGTATSYKRFRFDANGLTDATTITYTMPNASGTLALTSDIPSLTNYATLNTVQTFTAQKTFNADVFLNYGATIINADLGFQNSGFELGLNATTLTANRAVYLQDKAGTIALTSDLTGGTVTSVGLSSATSGVTIGSSPITTSGTITLTIATASGSQQGLLSSTDWTTFKNKQNALTNPVTGTGTSSYHAKFTGTSTIGNSMLTDNGTTLQSIGATRSNLYLKAASSSYYGQLAFTNGSNGSFGGISYNNSGQYMQFETNSSEWARLNSNGNFLIGTTSDNGSKLQVSGAATFSSSVTSGALFTNAANGTGGQEALRINNDNGYIGFFNTANSTRSGYLQGNTTDVTLATSPSTPLIFATANTEKMRITSSGNVGIGTTYSGRILNIGGNANPDMVLKSTVASGGAGSCAFYFGNSTNDSAGIINYDHASNYMNIFTNGAERMRITSGGYVLVGYTSNPSAAGLFQTTSAYVGILGTGLVYSLSGVLTSTNPSDLRLKDNVEDLGYGLKEILQLRPVKYNWKNDNANQGKQFGFIAQEVQEVMPELVTTFDTEDGERLGLEKEGIYAALVQAIKELKAEIDELKNK